MILLLVEDFRKRPTKGDGRIRGLHDDNLAQFHIFYGLVLQVQTSRKLVVKDDGPHTQGPIHA